MYEWYQKNKRNLERYAEANDALRKIRDVTKTATKAVPTFNKATLRTYLQNIGSNEKNLRNLSRYLAYRCQPYYKLIRYNADMFDLNARSVIPPYDPSGENDKESTLKAYAETLSVLDKLNLQYEFAKIYITCFREDVFYGCAYYDEEHMIIMPLDPDYCKIEGVYNTGDYGFAMDMTYFRSRQDLLESWGEPFSSMYKEYERDGIRYKSMPAEYAVCLKARAEDWETVVPPFSGLFNAIINLMDLEDIQAVSDEQEIYKMIWMEMETLTNATEPDDFKVDPDVSVEYFNRMVAEALDDYTTAAIIPGKLNTITFDNDKARDTNKVMKSTEAVFNSSGGAQILNSATLSGSTAFNAATKADTEYAISLLLAQTQSWVNRFLSYHVSNPCRVKFFEVSTYTRDEFRENLLKGAQYGLPVKLALNTLNSFSEKDTMALNFLEEDCLGITDKFRPLQSSYVQSGSSGNEGGGQEKSDTEITDDGDASKDKRDQAN